MGQGCSQLHIILSTFQDGHQGRGYLNRKVSAL